MTVLLLWLAARCPFCQALDEPAEVARKIGAVTSARDPLYSGIGELWVVRPSIAGLRKYQPPVIVTGVTTGKLEVLPKWSQGLWFWVVAAVSTIFLLCGLFLLGTAYLRRQRHELERQVALRTAELKQTTVELQESKRQLEHMAYTDSLTNLPNRRMFTEHFKRLLALKRRQPGSFAVLLMDFDDFKEINDTHGHDAGDAVLKEMARRMTALTRESDCLARLGGDELGLLVGDSPDLEGMQMVCHKVIQSFAAPVLFEGLELRTTPSIGVALYPEDGETQDRLYKAADIALYHAKRKGGNMCIWSESASEALELQ